MKKSHAEIMLETILDEVKAVHELVADVPKRAEFNELRQDVSELKQDVKTIRVEVTATNRDVAALDQRVTRLEAA
jgi:polyhydroxyalkanoate synthesis regulator phasin